MTKTLKLEEQTAKSLYKTASPEFKKMLEESFGEAFFRQDICDRIQTIDDVLQIVRKTYNQVVPFQYPKNKAQRSLNATALLQCITEAYNEGVQLDWSNDSQAKWYPWWIKKDRVGWVVYYYCCDCSIAYLGFGLYFVSEKTAKDAATKFKDIYLDYLPK